ncbi:MAG: group I intron-associated PD-(D/E)XK endonuclease [Halobacteriales archaeon]|nr:group I intron-associated PD-(D/E)XK endonuclease [Halobacteriales archaeon]
MKYEHATKARWRRVIDGRAAPPPVPRIMQSHRKGDLTEAIVIAELKRRSIPVSLPFGDNERYDLVIETPTGNLLRVQVKTGWVTDGKFEFHARSQHTNSTGNTYKTYDGDIDFFTVYCHELATLYLIQEDEFGSSISLRVEEPECRNRRINWADDFEFDARWPPEPEGEREPKSDRDTISRVIEILEIEDVSAAIPLGTTRYQLIISESDGTLSRMRVKSGWFDDGRIRYQHEDIPKDIDYLAIFVPDTDTLYIVPRHAFDSSILLRVDEPKKPDNRINWAEDYEFPKNIPW